jgi:uncharacterized Zn finger protein
MGERKYKRRVGRKKPEKRNKTPYEQRKTHEEVKKIKKNLVNFASTKWGKYWITSLLEKGRPFRMQRGIRYAEDDERIGNLTIHKGNIFATVQGTAPLPYRVKINFEMIPDSGWKQVINDLKAKLLYIIELLDGELPEDIVKIFRSHDFPLFPNVISKENAECTCPDKAVPCKHIAAVILYISRVLDYNPFILLELRGKTKEELMIDLRLEHKPQYPQERLKDIEIEMDVNKNITKFNVPTISVKELHSGEKNEKESELIGFNFKKPTKINETLENIGIPPNIEHPRAFSKVIHTIYDIIRKETYKDALKIESNKNDT